MPSKRIGVFGGSFDPPHLGHLLAAVYAKKVFHLNEVWFIPAYEHAFGKRLSPFSKREHLCKALLKGMGADYRVSDIERSMDSDGRMLFTLRELKRRSPRSKFILIIGSDQLAEADKWYRFSSIKKEFGICVVPRAGHNAAKGSFAIPNISSTEIRRREKDGDSLDGLLTPEVAKAFRR